MTTTHGGVDTVVVLGPTASGKTSLGVRLARLLGGEVVSADSRQVYRGLDVGSGKDLDEYVLDGAVVPHHLIDVVDLDEEYSVYRYQQDFYRCWISLRERGVLPVVVGGTGLYLDAVLSGYAMVDAPRDEALRAELAGLGAEELAARLRALRPDQHNVTDLDDRERTLRAIEIAAHAAAHPPPPAPALHPFVLGTRWPRDVLRRRIARRLAERMDGGLVEEVEGLHRRGVSWERLELLGLEYRFVAQFLKGEIRNRNDLFQKLKGAIAKFAKRQETWFRRMERRGTEIHWVDGADLDRAMAIIARANLG